MHNQKLKIGTKGGHLSNLKHIQTNWSQLGGFKLNYSKPLKLKGSSKFINPFTPILVVYSVKIVIEQSDTK